MWGVTNVCCGIEVLSGIESMGVEVTMKQKISHDCRTWRSSKIT